MKMVPQKADWDFLKVYFVHIALDIVVPGSDGNVLYVTIKPRHVLIFFSSISS